MKKIWGLIILTVLSFRGSAQDETFTPSGSAFAVIFANFHQGITNAASEESAFELNRGYLGYEYTFSPEFYARVSLDIGSPDDLSEYSKARRYAYFKNAYLRYTQDKVSFDFGLIGLRQYKIMESVWGKRYLMKSFTDEYSLGSSADLGMNINYAFSKKWDIDFTIMNGEGYNNVQSDGIFKYAVGTTVKVPKNFTSRLYFDFTNDEIMQTTYHLFASYSWNGKANIAGEALYRVNENFDDGKDRYGFSLYGYYKLEKKYQLFARFDKITSNKLKGESSPWNLANDGTALIAGIQYQPIRPIKFSLNYHDWVPYAANDDTDAFIFFNVEVKM